MKFKLEFAAGSTFARLLHYRYSYLVVVELEKKNCFIQHIYFIQQDMKTLRKISVSTYYKAGSNVLCDMNIDI